MLSDVADAKAFCEAVAGPTMRFVPAKMKSNKLGWHCSCMGCIDNFHRQGDRCWKIKVIIAAAFWVPLRYQPPLLNSLSSVLRTRNRAGQNLSLNPRPHME